MKVVAIVQARMSSTRLPGKVLMKIKNKPMLEHTIDRLKKAKTLNEIVIATTNKEQDKPIIELAKKCSVSHFAGSEDDVLDRYLNAAKKARADIIVRVTADCPLIDPNTLDKVVKCHLKSQPDYTRILIDENNPKSFPRGLDTEVFSMEALKRAHRLGKKPHHREHVTPFIYEHPEMFKVAVIEAKNNLRRPDLRLCADTKEDLRLIREIYDRLYKPRKTLDIHDVIKLLDDHPEMRHINIEVKQKEMKEY